MRKQVTLYNTLDVARSPYGHRNACRPPETVSLGYLTTQRKRYITMSEAPRRL